MEERETERRAGERSLSITLGVCRPSFGEQIGHLPKMMKIFSCAFVLAAVSIHCTVGTVGTADTERNAAERAFTCIRADIFPHPESCQYYYDCRLMDGELRPFLAQCPPGTSFDDVVLACRHKSYVTSPSHCVEMPPVTHEVVITDDGDEAEDSTNHAAVVSEAPTANDAVEVVPDETHLPKDGTDGVEDPAVVDIGGSATENDTTGVGVDGGDVDKNDTNVTLSNGTVAVNVTEVTDPVEVMTICDHMGIVDDYVNLIISNPNLQELFEHQIIYNKYVMKYNLDLEKAQNNSQIWRNGESILSSIRKTYQAASNYEMEFNRKYEINQERLKTLSNSENNNNNKNNERYIQRLKDDIERLQGELKASEQALELTDIPLLKDYLEKNVISQRQQIESKREELELSSGPGLVIKELIQFLEFVGADIKRVENLAKHSKDRMQILIGNLEGDSASFEKYFASAVEDIRSLEEEEERYGNYSTENRAEQESLEKLKDDLDSERVDLNNKNEANSKKMGNLRRKMQKKIDKFEERKEKLCKKGGVIDTYIKPNATDAEKIKACNNILEMHNVFLHLTEEQLKVKRLSEKNDANRNRIYEILSEMEANNKRSLTLTRAMPTYRTKLRQLDVELQSLRTYHADLENLRLASSSSSNSLLEIVKEFQEIQTSFENIDKEFNAIIAYGREAKTDEDREVAKTVMEERISDVKVEIEQLQLSDLGMCI